MKVRSAFVANSSSSSFLIVGQSFKTNEEAEELQIKVDKISKKNYSYVNYADDWDEPYIAGVDIDPGIADGCEADPVTFLNDLTKAIEICKKVGIENPQLYGNCSRS